MQISSRAKRPSLRVALSFVLVASTVGNAQSDDKAAPPSDSKKGLGILEVDVQVVKASAEFAVLEPIWLKVVARNVSQHRSVARNLSGRSPETDYRTFPIKVYDAKGQPVPRTRYGDYDLKWRGLPVGSGGGGAYSLINPGKEVRGELVANLAFDMSSPGDYTIIVEFPMLLPAELDDGKGPAVAQSKPIKVRVLDCLP